MRLLFIRHGDPDYEHDALTEKGRREAALLAERIAPMDVAAYFVSPMGRAQETASYTLKRAGRTAGTLPWLKEFDRRIDRDGTGKPQITWDMLPERWTQVPDYYDKDRWLEVPLLKNGGIAADYRWVTEGIDGVLAEYGYRREGNVYRAERPNEQTLVFFCHFGVTCVMLSHFLGVSPMVLWHGTMAAPSSVTALVTEERREGTAILRMLSFGDTAHLTAAGENPAFSGRFCERYTNWDQRHD